MTHKAKKDFRPQGKTCSFARPIGTGLTPIPDGSFDKVNNLYAGIKEYLASADYAPMEQRELAKNNPELLDSIKKGHDIHREKAAEMFNVTPEDVTPTQRNAAKCKYFQELYGGREIIQSYPDGHLYYRDEFDKAMSSCPFCQRQVKP